MLISVKEISSGLEITRYCASSIKESFDGKDYPLTDYTHTEYLEDPVVEEVNPADWRIYVGSFFDRFDTYGNEAKIIILASTNAVVQGIITDALSRKYIGLHERKAELTAALNLIQTLLPEITLDITAIIETIPTSEELYNG